MACKSSALSPCLVDGSLLFPANNEGPQSVERDRPDLFTFRAPTEMEIESSSYENGPPPRHMTDASVIFFSGARAYYMHILPPKKVVSLSLSSSLFISFRGSIWKMRTAAIWALVNKFRVETPRSACATVQTNYFPFLLFYLRREGQEKIYLVASLFVSPSEWHQRRREKLEREKKRNK